MPFRFNPLTGKLDIVDVSAPVPPADETTFVTDAGNALSVADSINMLGGANINTAGAGDTVTIALDSDVVTNSYATDTLATNVKIEDNTITASGTNANVDIGLVPKASGGVYVTTNLTVGQSSAVTSIPYGGGTLDVATLVDTEGLTDLGGVVENRHGDIPAFGAHHILARTRGTHAAPTTIVSGDTIGRFASFGYDGTEFVESTEITTSATGTIAAGKVPGQFVFSTADNATGALQTAMTIDNGQTTTVPRLVGTANITANFTSPVTTTIINARSYINALANVQESTNRTALATEYYGAESTSDANASTILFTRAGGTKASPSNLTTTNLLGQLVFTGRFSGANYIKVKASAFGTTNASEGRLDFTFDDGPAGTNSAYVIVDGNGGNLNIKGGFVSINPATYTPGGVLNTGTGTNQWTQNAVFFQTPHVFTNQSTAGLHGLTLCNITTSGSFGGTLALTRRRGVLTSPTTVQNNDMLGQIVFNGFTASGATNTLGTVVASFADGTVSAGVLPTRYVISTTNAAGTLTEAMRINSSQVTTLAQPLPVGSGGLGITTVPTNGQIPIGNGTTYTAATLTAGTGVSITNGAGSITINASGGTSWKTISANQTLVVGEGYFCISPGGALSLALPAVSAVGATIEIVLAGATSWTITQGAGQQVVNGNVSSTLGATGTTASTAQGDSVRLVCAVADTIWYIVNSFGNINSV